MNKCPLCGGIGTEIERRTDLHHDKMKRIVTLYCEHPGFGIITFYDIKDIEYDADEHRHGGIRTPRLADHPGVNPKVTHLVDKLAHTNERQNRPRRSERMKKKIKAVDNG